MTDVQVHTRVFDTACHMQSGAYTESDKDNLPLVLLFGQKGIQNADDPLERLDRISHLPLHKRLVVTQLRVKVCSVRQCAHGHAHDRLDEHAMVLLQCIAVARSERGRELFVWLFEVDRQRLAGEIETSVDRQ